MVAGTAVAYLYQYMVHIQHEELTGKHLLAGIPAIIYLACKTREEVPPIRDIFNIVYVLRVGDSDPRKLLQVKVLLLIFQT